MIRFFLTLTLGHPKFFAQFTTYLIYNGIQKLTVYCDEVSYKAAQKQIKKNPDTTLKKAIPGFCFWDYMTIVLLLICQQHRSFVISFDIICICCLSIDIHNLLI